MPMEPMGTGLFGTEMEPKGTGLLKNQRYLRYKF